MKKTIKNFGRNLEFSPAGYHRPTSKTELLEILGLNAGKRIRAIGSLHSWSFAPVTEGIVIDTSGLVSVEVIANPSDPDVDCFVTVGGGCKIKNLLKQLADQGLTLPSVGLIDEQTIAGATATGTHGSGKHSLSHYILAAEIAHFDENDKPVITKVTEGNELLAARCSLGLLGIIVSVTLQCREQYNVAEHAKMYDSVQDVLAQEEAQPLQQFYLLPWSWKVMAHHRKETDAERSKLAWLYRIYCFLIIDIGLHIFMFLLAKIFRVRWMIRFFFQRILPFTIIRNWNVVDDSSRALVMEHELFRHIEIEIFVQRNDVEQATNLVMDIVAGFAGCPMKNESHTRECLESIRMWDVFEKERGAYCHHYPICFRRILADDTLISMASPNESNRDWWAISFISYQWPKDRSGFYQFAGFVGPVMAKLFNARCHWGKYNPLDRETNLKIYPRMEQFKHVVKKFDPTGKFSNEWFDTHLV